MASDFIEKTTGTPILKMDIVSMLDGMVSVVKLRQYMEIPTKPSSTKLFSDGGLGSCDKALLRLGPVERTAVLKGTTRKLIRWHERAAGDYLFLHPNIYGLGSMKERAALVARVFGVGRHMTKTCFSLGDKKLRSYMEKWVLLVRYMTWKDAAGHFPPESTSQWDIGEEKLIPNNHLLPYEKYILGSRQILLSKFNAYTSTSGRKSAAKAVADTFFLKTNSFKLQKMTSAKGENINSRRDLFRTW